MNRIYPVRFFFILVALPLMLAQQACKQSESPQPAHKYDSTAEKGDTVQRPDTLYRENLPTGRFQLPTTHTPVPNLWITLPKGYGVKSVGAMPDDEFFIFRSDDPSLKDTSAVTPAFMRVYIGVMPQSGLDSGQKFIEKKVMVGNYPAAWRIWSERLPDGRPYYAREIKSGDFFARLSPELARAPLHLHLYVAGSDSARVAELMESARTISMAP